MPSYQIDIIDENGTTPFLCLEAHDCVRAFNLASGLPSGLKSGVFFCKRQGNTTFYGRNGVPQWAITNLKRKSDMKPYDHLPIVPTVIADSIVGQEYKAQELSSDIRSDGDIAEIEAGRQKLTIEQRREFADLCEVRCQKAYAAKAPWFLKIANAKDNSGRDQLYVWIRHWMTAYIADPVVFRSHCQ